MFPVTVAVTVVTGIVEAVVMIRPEDDIEVSLLSAVAGLAAVVTMPPEDGVLEKKKVRL